MSAPSHPQAQTGLAPNVVSRRPARLAAVMMLIQGILLAVTAYYAGRQIDWGAEVFGDGLSARAADTATSATFFIILAGAAVVAAVGSVFVRHFAWVLAMMVLALTLLASIVLYFVDQPLYGYVLMIFTVATVFYLNSTYVREAFQDADASGGAT